MYLVQLFITPIGDTSLPIEAKQAIETGAPEILEHVCVHDRTRPHTVISLFIRAASLGEAELAARQIWEHAISQSSRLARWTLLRAEVPLHPYDWE
ncbi:hypothetical protein [Streptomyces microflavus]|uniref:hypothetical protein n=1 Tax=Streptomyces microflavus TaxID=1919 RepID=UPI00340E816C